jgi:hypothetical protein
MSEKEEPVQMSEHSTPAQEMNPSKTVDTVHNDEAMRVLANYAGDETWTEAEENNLRRKIDWKLMPVLCVTYGLQYYDKAMLSQAVCRRPYSSTLRSKVLDMLTLQALFGLRTDLDLTVGDRYAWSASIFYLGFILGAYPAMILAQRFPVERVASAIVTLWGLTLILTTACTSYRGIYAQRFFLGFLESGVSPMFMLIVVC